MRRTLLVLIAVLLVAGACSSTADRTTITTTIETSTTTTTTLPRTPQTSSEAALPWWNERVFYEIFVRSFQDSDGDGIGDFAGLTSRLDYLNDGDPATTTDLGITGIWLMPIFPSPSYHGYDVFDYRKVNPEYGTMEDFTAFLDAAHERGIKVIIDLVINHTAKMHEWFRYSRDANSDYRDWYLWSATDPGTTGPWGQQVWHGIDEEYYFGLFWEGMPDLNLESPDVTAELMEIARFWLLEVGVDGFRLDAARHLIEDGEVMSDTPATVAWLEDFTAFVHSIAPEALVLGEVWSPTLNVAGYVPDALDLAFEFELAESGGMAMSAGDGTVFAAAMERVLGAYPDLQYATFLTNHDMNRIMSVVEGNIEIAKLAATWLLTSPGVPFLYYGEEIGLQGTKPDEEIRTPMPWTATPPGFGFTSGTPWEPADPGYVQFNVADEEGDADSPLALYRTLIQFRTTNPALRFGDFIQVATGSSTVLAFLRSVGDDHVLVILNMTPASVFDYALDLARGPLEGVTAATTVVGPASNPPDVTPKGGFVGYRPVGRLPGYGGIVIHLTE